MALYAPSPRPIHNKSGLFQQSIGFWNTNQYPANAPPWRRTNEWPHKTYMSTEDYLGLQSKVRKVAAYVYSNSKLEQIFLTSNLKCVF